MHVPLTGRRRVLVGAALVPVLAAALIAVSGGFGAGGPVWLGVVLVTAVLAASALSSYVPERSGSWRAQLGCTPCAAVSGLTVVGSALLLASAPHEVPMALAAAALAGLGLVQRSFVAPGTCIAA